MGTARDKAAHAEYVRPTYSQDQQYLTAFEVAWLPRRVVSQVAQDVFRKWRDWQADPAQISMIEKQEKRLDMRGILEDAYADARLRGVSYVYISIKGDEDRVDEPLNPEMIGRDGINHLNRLSKDDVIRGDIDLDPISPTYGKPKWYEIASTRLTRVHPSRMVVLYGDKKPFRFAYGVEANSVLEAAMPAIKRHDSTVANVASLVFEARVDVITIPGLANLMADPDTETQIISRFTAMASGKGNNGIVLLNGSENPDTPSETWEQKDSTFATLPEIIEKSQEEVSAAARIPRALLFGTSAGGLGATGNLELSAYYDHINTLQSNEIEPAIHILDECLIRSALGNRPDDIWYEWASLWQKSDADRASEGNMIADKWQKLVSAGVFPAEAVTQAVINELTEAGAGGGIEQTYADWIDAGGMDEEDTGDDIDSATE